MWKLVSRAQNLPLLKLVWEWPPDPRGPGLMSFEKIPRFGPKIGTLVRLKGHRTMPDIILPDTDIFRIRTWQDWSRKIRISGILTSESLEFQSLTIFQFVCCFLFFFISLSVGSIVPSYITNYLIRTTVNPFFTGSQLQFKKEVNKPFY